MQKIKKSLENNLLKNNSSNKNNFFLIENRVQDIPKTENTEYKSRVLSSSSLKSIELTVTADIKEAKFPLTLKSFETDDTLQKYFVRNLTSEKFIPILIKENNFIYKKPTFQNLKVVNFLNKFNNLKYSLESIILLLQLFKLKNL